jgi:alpha-tubulin suppressor-like RCC1 family protein
LFVPSRLQDAHSHDVAESEITRELASAANISEVALPLYAGEKVTRVLTRSFHSAALTDHGRLLVWGDNAYGQLGVEPANNSQVGGVRPAMYIELASVRTC